MTFNHKFQSLQYKLLHRLTNVNTYLQKCKIVPYSTCNFCFQKDTIEHLFGDCPFNQNLIAKCTEWLDKITEVTFNINYREFLLGILNDNNDEYINLYNRFFTFVKAFIWESRKQRQPPYLHNFLKFLKDEVVLEKEIIYIRFRHGKDIFQKRWLNILQHLNIDT